LPLLFLNEIYLSKERVGKVDIGLCQGLKLGFSRVDEAGCVLKLTIKRRKSGRKKEYQ
jgi:hypothetical protein